jgi:hypothetical protein
MFIFNFAYADSKIGIFRENVIIIKTMRAISLAMREFINQFGYDLL